MADTPDSVSAPTRWHRTLRVIAGLMAIWFGVTFGIAFYARPLDRTVLGWPFSFWVAAQGAQLVYLALVGGYAAWARRLDADDRRGDD
jgi:putative solute:sodium symporter small subunit